MTLVGTGFRFDFELLVKGTRLGFTQNNLTIFRRNIHGEFHLALRGQNVLRIVNRSSQINLVRIREIIEFINHSELEREEIEIHDCHWRRIVDECASVEQIIRITFIIESDGNKLSHVYFMILQDFGYRDCHGWNFGFCDIN